MICIIIKTNTTAVSSAAFWRSFKVTKLQRGEWKDILRQRNYLLNSSILWYIPTRNKIQVDNFVIYRIYLSLTNLLSQTSLLTEKRSHKDPLLRIDDENLSYVFNSTKKGFQKPVIQSRQKISFHDQSKNNFWISVGLSKYPVAWSSRLSSILKSGRGQQRLFQYGQTKFTA